jgi:hypothetical protein
MKKISGEEFKSDDELLLARQVQVHFMTCPEVFNSKERAFIVRAVNTYHPMLDALKGMVYGHAGVGSVSLETCIAYAKKAIARAEGK